MKMDQGWWDGVLSLALPLTYFVNFVAALNLWGPQFTTLKGEDWTWFCDFLPLKPRVEKGKIVFGNKIMESAVKDTCLFFFFFTNSCCPWQHLCCHSNQYMVESSDITLDCHGDEDALTNHRFHHHCARVCEGGWEVLFPKCFHFPEHGQLGLECSG